jgi:hypothetical protein
MGGPEITARGTPGRRRAAIWLGLVGLLAGIGWIATVGGVGTSQSQGSAERLPVPMGAGSGSDNERRLARGTSSIAEPESSRPATGEQPGENPLDVALAVQVIDRESRRPIDAAQAYSTTETSDPGFEYFAHVIPDPKRLVNPPTLAASDGRLVLRSSVPVWRGYVKAPGYAWARIARRMGPLSHVIALERGGTLRLTIRSWGELGDPSLVVRYADGQSVVLPSPRDDGTLVVEGMRCGQHTLHVLRGPKWGAGERYATVPFTIGCADTTDLIVAPEVPGARALVKLRGALIVDGEWPAEFLRFVHISLRGSDPTNIDVRKDAYVRHAQRGHPTSFEVAGLHPAGLYRVTVMPFAHEATVRFGEGISEPEIRIGDGRPVGIRLEGVGEADVSSAVVLWRRVVDVNNDRGGGLERAGYDASQRAFVLHAPVGTVAVRVAMPGFRQTDGQYLEIELGSTQFHVKMARAATLVVEVRCGSELVDAEIEPCRVPEEVGPTKDTDGEGQAVFADLSGGEYVIVARVPEGYIEPEPIRRTLREGEIVRVRFDVRVAVR